MDLILVILILAIPAIAQFKVTSAYNKYSKEENSNKLTGQEVARKILDKNGLNDVYVVETSGTLSDHYDSSRKVVRLSHEIFSGETIAAAAVAAHECGHAIQDKDGYLFMRIRSFIFPVVRICTTFSYAVIVIGFLMQALNLIYIGIAMTAAGLIFQLVTLPVEFDASRRAEKELNNLSLVSELEEGDIKEMLSAAAMTYVAGVLTSALELIRLIMALSDSNNK